MLREMGCNFTKGSCFLEALPRKGRRSCWRDNPSQRPDARATVSARPLWSSPCFQAPLA